VTAIAEVRVWGSESRGRMTSQYGRGTDRTAFDVYHLRLFERVSISAFAARSSDRGVGDWLVGAIMIHLEPIRRHHRGEIGRCIELLPRNRWVRKKQD